MKTKHWILILGIILINMGNVYAQRKIEAAKPPIKEKAKVDEGEMKTYVLVFLKKGPQRDHPEEKAKEIQAGHMEHLTKMHQEGMLLMAGPMNEDGDIRGILLMNTEEIPVAKDIVEQDPAIKSGRLIAEYHRWYTKSGTVTLP